MKQRDALAKFVSFMATLAFALVCSIVIHAALLLTLFLAYVLSMMF